MPTTLRSHTYDGLAEILCVVGAVTSVVARVLTLDQTWDGDLQRYIMKYKYPGLPQYGVCPATTVYVPCPFIDVCDIDVQ